MLMSVTLLVCTRHFIVAQNQQFGNEWSLTIFSFYHIPLLLLAPNTGPAWLLDLQLPVQSVHIIAKVVNLYHAHGEVYLIQYYVMKFVSDLRLVAFSRYSGFLHQ